MTIKEFPLVSIVIPTYNRSLYIKRAIESVLEQTYVNVEIIVINDNSTDNTLEELNKINHSNLKIFTNKTNKGAPYSRNRGVRLSEGEYINFLDDDDVITEDKISKQIDKFLSSDNKRLGVVTCDVEYKKQNFKMVRKNRKKGKIYADLLKNNCVYHTMSMLIKKDYLRLVKFDEDLVTNQEYDLMIQLSKICEFDYVPETLAKSYISENQISFNYRKKIKGLSQLWTKYYEDYKNNKIFIYSIIRYSVNYVKFFTGLVFGDYTYNKLYKALAKRNKSTKVFDT